VKVRVWIFGAALFFGGCKDEDAPVADPLDDPWVDAITAEEEPPAAAELVAVAAPEQAVIEASSPAEVQPASGVLATPSEPESEPEQKPKPSAAPEKSTAETQTLEEPTPTPEPAVEPAPAVDPTPSPSAEPTKPAEPASPPPITSADFHGNYRWVGGSSQRDELEAAIEATVDALPGALHGIARKRLTATNPVENTVDIVVAGDKVTTTFESGFNATCVIDGGTVNATDIEGGKLKVRLRWKDGKLIQQMEGKGGARTIVYVLSANRKKLTVHHKITSDRLPVPLTYRFSYTRK
jgi:hypothetical protein